MGDKKDNVAVAHPGQETYADARRLVRDFCAGTTAVHKNAEIYTPREGNINHDRLREDPYVWEQRARWTEVYSAVSSAKEASIGLILSQPPTLGKDSPQVIKDFAENIDGKNNHLMIFARELLDESVQDGIVGTMVDVPVWPKDVTKTEENRLLYNIRPSWARYCADDIINWDFLRVGASLMLTLLVLRECTVEKTGEFLSEEVVRYRVLRLDTSTGVVTWQLWREVKKKGGQAATESDVEYVPDGEGEMSMPDGKPMGVIPFVPTYGKKPDAPMVCAPPLAPVAELNLGYYRVTSDRRWAMHMHFAPTLLIKGREPGPDGLYQNVRLGAGAVVDVPIGGDAVFIAPPATGFDPSEKELARISQEMGSLSLAFLARDKGQSAETATARRLEAETGKSSLALLAHNLQDTLERLFEFTCMFLGLPDPGLVTVQVKMTYDLDKLTPQAIQALNNVVKDSNLSLHTFLQILKNGGVLPDETEVEDEELEIEQARQVVAEAAASAAADAHSRATDLLTLKQSPGEVKI
jgi:hypothetical protein